MIRRNPVTAKQAEVLQAIVRLKESLGEPPTALDIAQKLGIGRMSVYGMLRSLRSKRLVRMNRKVWKSTYDTVETESNGDA